MRAKTRNLLLAAVLALLVTPALASASPFSVPLRFPPNTPAQLRAEIASRVEPSRSAAGFRPGFTLKTNNGYRFVVFGAQGSVLVGVTRPRGRSLTVYLARGTVTPHRLQASFGKLGRIAMRFRPSRGGSWQRPDRRCRGKGLFMTRRGVYVGSARFRGEEGYVSIDADRVKGGIRGIAPACERGRSSRREELAVRPPREDPWDFDFQILYAGWRHAVDSASFGMFSIAGQPLFIATTEQSRGGVAKLQIALRAGRPKSLVVNDALTSARVSPPPPFEGSGIYRAAADGTTTWGGALSVDFPGPQRFPLTGPPFEATLEDDILRGN